MPTAITIAPPETEALERIGVSIVDAANIFTITDSPSMIEGGEHLRQIRTARVRIKVEFEDSIRTAHAAHKAILALKNKLDDPLLQAETRIKSLFAMYSLEQEAKRREEETRLREIALKEEEDRRLAEAQRLEDEAKAREAKGDVDGADEAQAAADATLDAEPTPVAIVLPSTTPKIKGVSMRTTWKFRIDNMRIIPREYMIPDEKAIRAYTTSMGEKAKMAGVSFYPHKEVAVKSH